MITNDGGPAFPSDVVHGDVVFIGMSLRDYFAAKALDGIMSNAGTYVTPDTSNAMAMICYGIADSMLRARMVHS